MHLNTGMVNQLKILSTLSLLPDGTSYKTILAKNVKKVAKKFKVSLLEVEIVAVENKIMPEHYTKNMKSISFSDQLKLLNARICIVGLGGLGGIVLENLVRIGIGYFRLIDGDTFQRHNLNRQILSSNSKIGKSKTATAAKRIFEINPAISVVTFNEYLTEHNADYIIDECDIIVDCLDNIKTRFLLESVGKNKNLPLVSAAVAGAVGHVTTIYPYDKGLELIFGKEADVDVSENKGQEVILGSPSYSVTTVASIESSEVVKLALGKQTLRNKLLVIDMEDYTFEKLNLT